MSSKLVKVWRSLPIAVIAWANFSASVDLVLGKGYELQGNSEEQLNLRNNYSKFLADKFTFTHLFQALLIIGLWHFAWLEVTPAAVAFCLTLFAPILAKAATDFMQRINIEVFGALNPEPDAPRTPAQRSWRSVLATIFIGTPLLVHNVVMSIVFIPYAISVKALGLVLAGAADFMSMICCCYPKDDAAEQVLKKNALSTSSSLSRSELVSVRTQDDTAISLSTTLKRQVSGDKDKTRFAFTPNPAGTVALSGPTDGNLPPPLDLDAAAHLAAESRKSVTPLVVVPVA